MILSGVVATGPFRGALPFDESGSSVFFGRHNELEGLCAQLLQEGIRVSALTGPSGVGKTSLLRAGLHPALAAEGILGLYIGDYQNLEQEIIQAASRSRGDAPSASETMVDYVARLAKTSRGGAVLVLDHLEGVVSDQAQETDRDKLTAFLGGVLAAGGSHLRVLFSLDSDAYHLLGRLLPRSVLAATGSTFELRTFDEDQAAAVIEQTALQTGTFIEAGLAGKIASDLCRKGRCFPLDLQMVARTMMDLRLTSIRRYERSGGAVMLAQTFFDRVVGEAGGRTGLRVLLDVLSHGLSSVDDIATRIQLPKADVDRSVSTFLSRGVFGKREGERADRFAFLHPALAERAAAYCALDRAKADRISRRLRQRMLAGQRLTIPELFSVWRHLGKSLSTEEQNTCKRSIRRKVFNVGLTTMVLASLVVVLFVELRNSYSLDFDPKEALGQSRVVVRMGRPGRPLVSMLPHDPPFGSVVADTGFSRAGLAEDLRERIEQGHVTGKLERSKGRTIPGWLQTVLSGLRPVQRGSASLLLGEPTGIKALQQAFADPVARRETLDVLEVVGQGGAGEEELLAAALSDTTPELRRRGVEVAAAIDRRLGNSAHAATLKAALSDPDPLVRNAVLSACSVLPPIEASGVLRVALAHAEPQMRLQAEETVIELANRSPKEAALAAASVAQSNDATVGRSGLDLLEKVASLTPKGTKEVLQQVVADATAPEDTRVVALRLLRLGGDSPEGLRDIVAQAIATDGSPRLRSAALPIYARTITPEAAEELARTESKGSGQSRAAAAAIWVTLIESRPEASSKALKAALLDPAPEVRAEAARALGFLRRDAITVLPRTLLDPNLEVLRGGLESSINLAAGNFYAVVEALTKGLRVVRPGWRTEIVQALGKVGEKRANSVLPPIMKVFKEGPGEAKRTVARTLCSLSRFEPQVVSPYLRIVARDPDSTVRAAAANCLEILSASDPKGAARLAKELSQAEDNSVKMAATQALGQLAPQAPETAVPALLELTKDPQASTRRAALAALAAAGKAGLKIEKTDEAVKSLEGLLAHGDQPERLAIASAASALHLAPLVRLAAMDRDDAIRIEALRGAAALEPPAIDLLRAAADNGPRGIKAEAMALLVHAGGEASGQVLPIFEAMVHAGDVELRRTAALGR
jgi:DNA-binding MarR family transcriptional regulator